MPIVPVMLQAVSALALALWVGGLFALVLFTPILFAQLESRELAGRLAGMAIARVDSLGMVAGGVLLLAHALDFSTAVTERGAAALPAARLGLVIAMLAATLLNTTLVRDRMRQAKDRIGGPIDSVAPSDPRRQEYRRLHRISSLLYAVTLILGLVDVVLVALG